MEKISPIHSRPSFEMVTDQCRLLIAINDIHIFTQNAATNIIDPNMEDGSVEEKMKQEADDVVENQQVEEDGYVELHRVSSNESTVRLSIYNV